MLTLPVDVPVAPTSGSTWNFVWDGECTPVYVDYAIEEIEVAPGYDLNDANPPLAEYTMSWRNKCLLGKTTFWQYGCVHYDASNPVLGK
ncbi:MAG TPA: hypothetical protein VL400_15050 [Polyangiaceae bacterium]|nr:hypothetical protein [Polyangiaceae bacterium]